MVFNSIENIYYNAGGSAPLPLLFLPDVNGVDTSIKLTGAVNTKASDNL